MNCHDCRQDLVAYVEELLAGPETQAIEEHLADCASCRAEEVAFRRLHGRLLAAQVVSTGIGMDQAVMDRIFNEQVHLTRRLKVKRRLQLFVTSGVAAALLVSLTWAALRHGSASAAAAEVLARGAQATSGLKSVYFKCRMRTLPADNFSYIDLKHDFVDVQLWEDYGDPKRWKIEKPGRVAVMDGKQTMMLMGGRFGVKLDAAAPEAFDTGWLHRLAAVDRVLSSELAAISAAGYDVKTVQRDEATHQAVVEVDTKGKVGEYLKNKFFETSDTRRIYSFDPETGRLAGAKFYCHGEDGDVLVLDILEIKYDQKFDDSVFRLDAPEGVAWYEEPQRLPDNEKYEKMKPGEAARAFFEACAQRNWDEARKFKTRDFTEQMKQYLGGLEIIKLGEPFQASPFPGWFIPYEIRLSNGEARKWNLSMRNDNPAHRFVVDGGL